MVTMEIGHIYVSSSDRVGKLISKAKKIGHKIFKRYGNQKVIIREDSGKCREIEFNLINLLQAN